MGLAGWMKAVAAELGGLVGVNADSEELLLLLTRLPLDELFRLMFIRLDDDDEALELPVSWASKPPPPPPAKKVALPPAEDIEPRLRRSPPRFERKPPAAFPADTDADEEELPVPRMPSSGFVEVSTFGAEVFRPSMGVGSAGLMKRSLARRFWIKKSNI